MYTRYILIYNNTLYSVLLQVQFSAILWTPQLLYNTLCFKKRSPFSFSQ